MSVDMRMSGAWQQTHLQLIASVPSKQSRKGSREMLPSDTIWLQTACDRTQVKNEYAYNQYFYHQGLLPWLRQMSLMTDIKTHVLESMQWCCNLHNAAALKSICRIRVSKPDLFRHVAPRLVLEVVYHLATCLV